MDNRFEQIRDLILGLEGDFDKFYNKNNQAAGTRVRQGMQTLKELAQDIRMEVQKMKNEKEEGK
ncbi:MAG: histone H1 [Bacteroidetes bacterium]|nr:MAG: histone H1 [Bacteroidota bacterium]